MNIQNIFANGLPDELANLILGQVVIFSSPEEGMSEKNIRISQYVSSVAKHLKQNCGIIVDTPAVFVVPTENYELWDSIACKVSTPQVPIVELADLGSLTEMLYDYWRLDFDKVLKPTIASRYDAYHITIASHHPSKLCIAPIKKAPSADSSVAEPDSYDFGSTHIDFLYAKGKEPTKNDISKKIQKILWEADMYGVDIDYEKIRKAFDKEKVKSYTLDVELETEDVISVKEKMSGKTDNWLIKKCNIVLVDESSEKHLVKLEAQEMAMYLTFMLYNDGNGIKMIDFDYPNRKTTKEFITLLKDIHNMMPNCNSTNLLSDEYKEKYKKIFSEIRSRIKNKISKITMNPRYLQAFTIEGEKEGLYRVEASTEELRDMLKEKLHLQ